MRKTLGRIGVGAAMAVGSLGASVAIGTPQPHATGPAGCVAQGANGFVAVGTVTDGPNPMVPPPSNACTSTGFVEPAGSGGGWVGADSASWKVTILALPAPLTAPPAKDANGQSCGTWTATTVGTTTTWSQSGSGATSDGVGCIPAGATATGAAG